MEKLGLIDQIFYKADQYGLAKLVMGGASILEPARPGGRLDASKIADHIAARLEKNPLLRRKFIQDPLRLGRNFPVMNAVLSNVPGPRETMYLGNSRVAESIPLVPPIEVLAVSGGVTSVSNTITLGFNCDTAVVQNPELLVKGADYGLAALRKAGEKIDRGRSHAGRKAQLSPRKRGKSAKSKKLSA